MATIHLPRQLSVFTEGLRQLTVEADDLWSAITSIVQKYPSLKDYLVCSNQGLFSLSSFVNFYLNGNDIRVLSKNPSLKDKDIIEIIPATAGG